MGCVFVSERHYLAILVMRFFFFFLIIAFGCIGCTHLGCHSASVSDLWIPKEFMRKNMGLKCQCCGYETQLDCCSVAGDHSGQDLR